MTLVQHSPELGSAAAATDRSGVRLAVAGPPATTAALARAVRLTARTSALLFAAARATQGRQPGLGRASAPLYAGFMTAHATHFAAVARYAVVTSGRDLFPGGRSLDQVGGWPTVAGIYGLFTGLAVATWVSDRPGAARHPRVRRAGATASTLIASMFVGTYLGRVSQSRWHAVPALLVAAGAARDVRRAGSPGSTG